MIGGNISLRDHPERPFRWTQLYFFQVKVISALCVSTNFELLLSSYPRRTSETSLHPDDIDVCFS